MNDAKTAVDNTIDNWRKIYVAVVIVFLVDTHVVDKSVYIIAYLAFIPVLHHNSLINSGAITPREQHHNT
ncbi:hypothetical protein FF38_14227 [Lucilia cuprina]|uniref:Uncharacterized protein n=1 Tax=Lucilia cuprina TaxID=7375 RepID=A0A0L0BPU2_LUCCU|nr:hypothetical protein FF38_14227 [Lucilia cuprina]